MIGTTNIQTAFKWLMRDSTVELRVHQTKLGVFYTIKKRPSVTDYLKWQEKNREYLEARFSGYLDSGNQDKNFDDFCRKIFSEK